MKAPYRLTCLMVMVMVITLSSNLVTPAITYPAAVTVLKENCEGENDGVLTWLPNNVTVLPLSCDATSLPSLPSRPSALVVLASCETVNTLASSEGVVSNSSSDGTYSPLFLLPVPTRSYTCGGRFTQQSLRRSLPTVPCYISLHPLRRAVDLTLSWMVYHSWNALTLLYDTSLDLTSHVTLVKRLLEGSGRVGASVALLEVEEGGARLEVVLEKLLSGWREEGARRLVVVARDTTVVSLLSLISQLVLEEDESDCDWLIFSTINSDVIDHYTPITGHRVYFVNNPLLMDQQGRGQEAVKLAEFLTNITSSCWEAFNVSLPQIPVYVKRPNYEAVLSPRVTMAESGPTLVPVYSWSPPALGESIIRWTTGTLKPLSARPQYQLYGAHLIVATLRGEPFVKAIMENTTNSTGKDNDNVTGQEDEVSQASPSPRQELPQHVTCHQPIAFVGFLVDMLQVLSTEMNFTYTMYEVCDASYGSKVNGVWTGVVGEVIYKRAHIGLANLGANYARSLAVSFPRVSTSYGGAGIILKRPPTSVQDLLVIYLLPFSTSVWSCVLATVPAAALTITLATCPRHRLRQFLFGSCVPSSPRQPPSYNQKVKGRPPIKVFVTSPGLTVTDRTHVTTDKLSCSKLNYYSKQLALQQSSTKRNKSLEKQRDDRSEVEENDEPQSFLNGVWFASTVLMQQGQDVVPRTGVARFVFGVMWVSSVVLYAAYTSNLVSHFTVTKQSLPVNNLEELAKSDYYKFGTRTGSVYIDNLKTSTTEVYEAAYRRLDSFDNSVFMPDYETAIATTQRGSYAFIADYVVLDYYQKKDCDLVLLKQQLFPSMSSFVLPRHSPLLPAFNHYLARMSESGILEKLRQRWWSGQPCPDATTVTAYQSVQLSKVVSALFLMGLGMLVSLVVCCCEYFICPRQFSRSSTFNAKQKAAYETQDDIHES
ncbi:hypothetical protein Pmani_026704 [Petrolisthes manimaculis]|uniref:Uncharacterized protein n=1 Tax=Petrolisthes manimaculis TaxID=1843537 RepID=A0AAE1P3L9_9EUCA|nr:hypothetical protein Pmani_026704 [Petrolisthes manimaculis]